MPTTLYYTDTLSALTISGKVVRSLSTTRGSAVVTKSQTSDAFPPDSVYDTGTTPLAFAYRVAAYSATTGTYTHNHWGFESSAKANYTASTAAGGSVSEYTNAGAYVQTLVAGTSSATEYGTAAAVRSFTVAGNARSVADGNWIVAFPTHDAVGTAAAGYTLNFSYNGTTAAANGDAYTTFPDTISPYVASADQPYISPYIQILAQ